MRLLFLTVGISGLFAVHAALAQDSSQGPPPKPSVVPTLPDAKQVDADGDKIDDRLSQREAGIRGDLRSATEPDERARLEAELTAPVRIELVFSQPVTQQDLDAFRAMGGQVDHIYRAVSYGWTGTLPLSKVSDLPAKIGASLFLVVPDREAELHLDEATQGGRVRPVWAPGFAGSVAGFDGDDTITIAIIDDGVDDTHPDLAGRGVFWKDYTSDEEPNPIDIGQHGSHVAGIAVGSGAAHGAATATLRYTDSVDLTFFPRNSFSPSPVHLPQSLTTFAHKAVWIGGGVTNLSGVFQRDGGGLWFGISAPVFGPPGVMVSNTFIPNEGRHYSSALTQNEDRSVRAAAIVNTVTGYPAIGDGFNVFRGVAPGANWAGAKVFSNAGFGSSLDIEEAMDDIVDKRVLLDIKVANMSLGINGDPGIAPTVRAKANTMVDNGIVTVISAGNDGAGQSSQNLIDDPGRAAKVLTVASNNDINQLTEYTSSGFLNPRRDEDHKPDVMAPGGSFVYSNILSVDSNTSDAFDGSFPDEEPDDYYNISGTSMASPFVAGAAALVIDALQQSGLEWDHDSNRDSLFVKMLLCATATESNEPREAGSGTDPMLGRSAEPKDRFEGYGIVNPDAAVEAATLSFDGTMISGDTDGERFSRRAWARSLPLDRGDSVTLQLDVSPFADFDLYVYRGRPDDKGNPEILAASDTPDPGGDESVKFDAPRAETYYVVVKRVSGSGDWTLTGSIDAPTTTTSVTITTTSTSVTSTSSMTTSTLGNPDVCAVRFDVASDADLIGALSFDVDYAAAEGSFFGTADDVACVNLSEADVMLFNDVDEDRRLSVAANDLQGIVPPTEAAGCVFVTFDTELASDDFAITVTDASDPDFQPVNADVTANVRCPDCGQPVSTGDNIVVSDCLYILNAAVGAVSCVPDCICDIDGDGSTDATDSLLCLNASVGLPVELRCPCFETIPD